MIFYTIDRGSTLKENLKINLKLYDDISPTFLKGHVDSLFPDGLSSHGEHYFLRNNSKALNVSPMLELIIEYVRRADYKNKPSRFQSFFAFDSLSQAKDFRSEYGETSNAIYKINTDIYHKANMKLLYAGNSILVTSYFANSYWQSVPGIEEICWEYLLPLPVTILDRIE